MDWRFRRTSRSAPGVRWNIGTRGTSWSLGPRGFKLNFSKRGVRKTVSIPGTGLPVFQGRFRAARISANAQRSSGIRVS
jgi:hypothetical protein